MLDGNIALKKIEQDDPVVGSFAEVLRKVQKGARSAGSLSFSLVQAAAPQDQTLDTFPHYLIRLVGVDLFSIYQPQFVKQVNRLT